MPPALHPRSRQTSTLFTTTLAVSFLVVGIPHLLPCPVDRRQFADSLEMGSDGKPVRRRRKQELDMKISNEQVVPAVDDLRPAAARARECPVPKPGGILGEVMGFKKTEKEEQREVVVQHLPARRSRDSNTMEPS